MDVKIITCHDVYNYGASLQAYALSNYVKEKGCQIEIVNYLPSYKPCMYDLTRLTNNVFFGKTAKMMPFLQPLCGLLRNRHLIKFLGRKAAFDSFKANYLKLTKENASTFEDLKNLKISCDLMIAGSDQIWNPNYGNGWDESYYCGFVSDKVRCISYAASFGISKFEKKFSLFVKRQLEKFSAISVREESGVTFLKEIGIDSVNVLDPVFLLDSKKWSSLTEKKLNFKYLLIYDFHNDNTHLKDTTKKIADKLNLKIVAINEEVTIPYADININNAGPIEFLSLIKNADFVIASSFHATAFSLIFNKDFYVFPLLGHNNSSRITDLLRNLNLSGRYDPIGISTEHIDYDFPNKKLQEMIFFSKSWLNKQLYRDGQI